MGILHNKAISSSRSLWSSLSSPSWGHRSALDVGPLHPVPSPDPSEGPGILLSSGSAPASFSVIYGRSLYNLLLAFTALPHPTTPSLLPPPPIPLTQSQLLTLSFTFIFSPIFEFQFNSTDMDRVPPHSPSGAEYRQSARFTGSVCICRCACLLIFIFDPPNQFPSRFHSYSLTRAEQNTCTCPAEVHGGHAWVWCSPHSTNRHPFWGLCHATCVHVSTFC